MSESSIVENRPEMKGKRTKKGLSKEVHEANQNMRPEYDLRSMDGGVRGKYYEAYREGHTVKVHKADGTTLVQHFKLEDGAVMLEPDVQKHFPDSEAVNQASRCLIPLVQNKRSKKASS